jgi:hypothetical protein
MAQNLRDRATTQLALHEAAAATIDQRLIAAREELTRRHPDPASVPQDQWAAQLGATQHAAVSREALAALHADEQRIRTQIATIANPADAATFEDELRELLVEAARLRVEHRYARERVAGAESLVDALGRLAGAVAGGVEAARARRAEASTQQEEVEALAQALAAPPLDTVVADAAAVVAGSELTDARDRLAELIPDELRNRAAARYDEATAARDAATDHLRSANVAVADLDATISPIRSAVATADAEFGAAVTALRTYATTAAEQLAGATALLPGLADLADLTAAQEAALDPAGRATAVAAVGAEGDLATAVADVGAAGRDVDDAALAALVADPDADPFADAAVVAALAALNDAALQDPLNTARGDYDAAARDALDEWEVEVPPDLWTALGDLVAAERRLARLADQAARDALATDLDSAQDVLAAALDAADVEARKRWRVALVAAERAAQLAATESTAADRSGHYLRGDGPAGRTPPEL